MMKKLFCQEPILSNQKIGKKKITYYRNILTNDPYLKLFEFSPVKISSKFAFLTTLTDEDIPRNQKRDNNSRTASKKDFVDFCRFDFLLYNFLWYG